MQRTYDFENTPEEPTEWDWRIFDRLTSLELDPGQVKAISNPDRVFEDPDPVLAVHWHPEQIPLNLVKSRIDAMYPCAGEKLVIPTQHNEFLTYDGYAGVEVDCRASAFNRKIQILLHFPAGKIARADNLKSMVAHTYRYRQTQLFDFLETFIRPEYGSRLQDAARQTGAEEGLVRFAGVLAGKLNKMIRQRDVKLPDMSLKNKLLINYVNSHKDFYDAHLIDRTAIFVAGVKEIVKRNFSLDYFYEVNEVIEETRALGGCIVVPHPEQFWPVLLADYDVDGYEVWNPQSREFTEFLIQTVVKKNRYAQPSERRLLVTMGDDTHLSEKLLEPDKQSPDKASREVGLQPPWRDMAINKILNMGNFSKANIVSEYRSRLGGPA